MLVVGECLHDLAQHRVLEEGRDILLCAEVRLQYLRRRRPVTESIERQIHALSWLALCRTLSLNASACCFCCSFSARRASLRWCSSNTALFSGRCRKILKPSSCLLAWTVSVQVNTRTQQLSLMHSDIHMSRVLRNAHHTAEPSRLPVPAVLQVSGLKRGTSTSSVTKRLLVKNRSCL